MFCAPIVHFLFPIIFVCSLTFVELVFAELSALPNKQKDVLLDCEFTAIERDKIRRSLTKFAVLKQKPFENESIKIKQNDRVEMRFPQKVLAKKRYLLLRPIIDIVLKSPKCATRVLNAYEKIMVAERGGKALQRFPVRKRRTDNHRVLAQLIIGTREILDARARKIPVISTTERFLLEGLYEHVGMTKAIIENQAPWIYASQENRFEKDPTKHLYFVLPQACLESVKKKKNGILVIQIRFPKIAQKAKAYANKLPQKVLERLDGEEIVQRALRSRWQDIQLGAIEIHTGFNVSTGETLAVGVKKVDPTKGTTVTFTLSPNAAKYARIIWDKGLAKERHEFNIRLAYKANYDGRIETLTNQGAIQVLRKW